MLKSEFKTVVTETRLKLEEYNEWRERYTKYAEDISCSLPFIKSMRGSFREWSPLRVYLNITNAKTAKNSGCFELRYMGQTVATLIVKKNKGLTLTTKGYDQSNLSNFDCTISLSNNIAWDSPKAAEFRSYFKHRTGARKTVNNKKNNEHRLESLFLTEFSKRKNKIIRNIKPVTFSTVRFPMPTPISASNHRIIKYSGYFGGGIDILTRTGTGGKATRLCIIELKDENTLKEPPKEVMKQAIAYTTFIRELLRSDAGTAWWKFFGFGGKIPDTLELYAACLMPSNSCNDYSFGDVKLDVEHDVIKLHYLYFREEDNTINFNPPDTTL